MKPVVQRTAIAGAIAVAIVSAAFFIVVPRAFAQTQNSCSTEAAARKSEAQGWLAAYSRSEIAYNELYKAVARAAHAPSGFVWEHVSPGIAQGPNIPDSLDGVEILRADLYYGHAQAEAAREACRALNCDSYTLPTTHASAQAALTAYQQAIEALPRFSGSAGMRGTGTQRIMNMHDAAALEQLAANGSCENDGARSDSSASDQGAALIAGIGRCETPAAALRQGNRGENVRRLQNFLVSRGLMTSENATGFFGRLTERAVQNFQTERGIVTSGTPNTSGYGRVGGRTLAAIRSMCGNAPATVPRAEAAEANARNGEQRRQDPADVYDAWMRSDVVTSESDMCTNIAEIQTIIPYGYMRESGQCVRTSDEVNPDTPINTSNSAAKPTMAQFLAATHSTNPARASSLLYGVIGSMKDLRDWPAIMASSDPLTAACEATAEMFNSGRSAEYMPSTARRFVDMDQSTVTLYGQTKNFVFYKEVIPGAGVHYNLMLTDSEGYFLTPPANPDILVQHLNNFCFDKTQLNDLQAQVDASGLDLTAVTSWPKGFIGWGKSPQGPVTPSTPAATHTGARTIVTLVYSCMLDRTPTETDVAYLAGRVTKSGEGVKTLIRDFFRTPEFVDKNVSNDVYAAKLYKCILQRDAGASELTYWTDQLANGQSRSTALEAFLSTPEFVQNVLPILVTRVLSSNADKHTDLAINWVVPETNMGSANEQQLASVLTALDGIVQRIMAWFKPKAAVVTETSTGTSSKTTAVAPAAPAPQPTTAPAPTTAPVPEKAAVQSSGTLKATFKGVALPDIPNVTKQLAQALCRPDAVCVWNNETIQAVAAFGKTGDPTITFTLPLAGSKQTLSGGVGYTFEFTDTSLPSGPIAANTYRLYFAKYTSPSGPDVIYQGQVTSVQRMISGAVQLKWQGRIQRADGTTEPLPAGFYYAGAVNSTNGLKGGSTGSITISAQ